MNRLEFLKLIANAPKRLKGYSELLDYARNAYKQIMGVFPEGIDNISIKQAAKEAAENRSKVIKFPEGGKDKTDFFSTRPDPRVKQPKGAKMDVQRANENLAGGANYAEGDTKYNADILADEIARMRGAERENLPIDDQIKLYGEAYDYLTQFNRLNKKATGEFGITVLDDAGKPVKTTTGETPESLMNKLVEMTNQNLKDRGLGSIKLGDKIPPPKNKKPAVDPELQKAEDNKQMFMDFENRIETEAEMLERMNRQNKEAVERIKKRKEKDFDPEDKAEGGRIGFSGGGAGFAGDPMQGDQYVMSDIPGSPEVPMGQIGPLNVGIFGGGGFSKNQVVPGVDRATIDQNYGIMGQIPIGNTGFTLGGSYMKSRANERFTGPRIPNQVFKNVPTDSDRFNIGINFRKQFKDGSKPPNFGRRNFLKLMGGLASIPIIGKYFKPAAKVADKAAPVIQEGVKLGYENFMLLVDKIKRFGKPADDLATQERQRVTTYSGKNGNEYELVEDLTTGDMTITKDKTGFIGDADQTIDVIEDRSTFIYKKGEDIVDTKTGKSKRTPDEYDEVKQTSSGPEDAFDDVTEIDDRSVNEVIDELRGSAEMDDLTLSQTLGPGSPRSKKAGGGLAYMLGE